ncbi:unnamed protein product [Soboliphyme baturini]|uniref:Cytosolic Fe-S cluster assembly factor NUBP2 homolog n=1 Tax=Soboliphyme baturini TaxID=241478 RepID=A0A183IMP7_9BILA|nr:unnamed protein product [Soboliphyme baturini]
MMLVKFVGLLDADFCGPSVAAILSIDHKTVQELPQGWAPVHPDHNNNLAVMSLALMLETNMDPVIWRGPKKTFMISQLLSKVLWGDIEYLVIDTPPGTSDEHMAVLNAIKDMESRGAVIVTTPQAVAIADVRREITFCRKTGINMLGIIENMSGYLCPHCTECINIFSSGAGTQLAEYAKIPFLGKLLFDERLTQCMDRGENYAEKFPDSELCQSFNEIVDKLISAL